MSQLRLEAELADSRLLQAISSELITENDEKGFRERLLDAAISIMHSDCASLQMFKEDAKRWPPRADRQSRVLPGSDRPLADGETRPR